MEKVRIEHFGVMILLKAQLVPWKEKLLPNLVWHSSKNIVLISLNNILVAIKAV